MSQRTGMRLSLAFGPSAASTFEVGGRYRCTMRVDCGRLDPGVVIRPELGEWHPRMPDRLDEEELADWRAGRDAVYQLGALTVGAGSRSPTDKLPSKRKRGITGVFRSGRSALGGSDRPA